MGYATELVDKSERLGVLSGMLHSAGISEDAQGTLAGELVQEYLPGARSISAGRTVQRPRAHPNRPGEHPFPQADHSAAPRQPHTRENTMTHHDNQNKKNQAEIVNTRGPNNNLWDAATFEDLCHHLNRRAFEKRRRENIWRMNREW